jgi:hypothetical protein
LRGINFQFGFGFNLFRYFLFYGNALLIEKDVGLLLKDAIKLCASNEIVVAIIPLSIETFTVAVVVARAAPSPRVDSHSVQIELLRVRG